MRYDMFFLHGFVKVFDSSPMFEDLVLFLLNFSRNHTRLDQTCEELELVMCKAYHMIPPASDILGPLVALQQLVVRGGVIIVSSIFNIVSSMFNIVSRPKSMPETVSNGQKRFLAISRLFLYCSRGMGSSYFHRVSRLQGSGIPTKKSLPFHFFPGAQAWPQEPERDQGCLQEVGHGRQEWTMDHGGKNWRS